MKKLLLVLIAIVLSLGPVAGQQMMVRITYFGHLYLESQINGYPALLAFDTGSPYTCMDSTYIAETKHNYKNVGQAKMGGTGNGQETVRIIVGELTYTIAGKEYQSKYSPIVQLKPVLGDQADGILGIDNMGGKVITIDYVGEQMGFGDRVGDTSGYSSIPIRYENNRIYIPLKVVVSEGKTIEGEGLMDLGNGGTVDFTSGVAEQYGLKDITPQMPYTFTVGGIGGESFGCDFRAKSASVGGYTLNDITVDYSKNSSGALSSREYIALIGNDFWERFDMILDLPDKRLYLRPNVKFEEPFKSPVLGFSLTDRSRTLGCWVVNCLYEESNAEKAGLRGGDHIIAINGRSVKEIDFKEMWNAFDEMTSVTLTVQRENKSQEITFDFDEPKI